jgi:thioredoxin 1
MPRDPINQFFRALDLLSADMEPAVSLNRSILARIKIKKTKAIGEDQVENIHVVQGLDWETLQAGPNPVLVDFWAAWCMPCRMLAPTFEKLAHKFGSNIRFAKVDVDELPELAARFNVQSIPTLLLLKGGKQIERWVGARPYSELAKSLESHLPVSAKN